MVIRSDLAILYQAMAEPIGLIVRTDNVMLAARRLNAARKQSGDLTLSILQFRRSPDEPETELWILKAPKKGTPPEEELILEQNTGKPVVKVINLG